MGYLIGLCGYAQVGKDTAARFMPGWRREAFGDELRADLAPVLQQIDRVAFANGWADGLHLRELKRPVLVAYAEAMRAIEPTYWVGRLWGQLAERSYGNVVITDVRNVHEVERILDPGFGFISLGIIFIDRPGYGPANEVEAKSIQEIMARWPDRFPRVVNDGTPEELGAKILGVINHLITVKRLQEVFN